MTPRYLRQPAAAAYLGVSVTHFTRHVRRELREVKIGGVLAYDRLDLDAWADDHTARYGSRLLRPSAPCRLARYKILNYVPQRLFAFRRQRGAGLRVGRRDEHRKHGWGVGNHESCRRFGLDVDRHLDLDCADNRLDLRGASGQQGQDRQPAGH